METKKLRRGYVDASSILVKELRDSEVFFTSVSLSRIAMQTQIALPIILHSMCIHDRLVYSGLVRYCGPFIILPSIGEALNVPVSRQDIIISMHSSMVGG